VRLGLQLVSARPAAAATITPGSLTFFNFDFTAQVPPPPYADFPAITVSFANVDLGDAGSFQFYDGLNGTGATFGSPFSGPVPTASFIFFGVSDPEALDGVFSLAVTGTAGTHDILSVVATAHNAADATAQLTAIPIAATVPERATMGLLLTGLRARCCDVAVASPGRVDRIFPELIVPA
jgi:hypothetical protein